MLKKVFERMARFIELVTILIGKIEKKSRAKLEVAICNLKIIYFLNPICHRSSPSPACTNRRSTFRIPAICSPLLLKLPFQFC